MNSPLDKVLLTGASGFVGSHLARRLLDQGIAVAALSRAAPDRLPAGVTHHPCDGTLACARAALAATRPQVVIHLASLFLTDHRPDQVDALIDSNIRLGAHLLEAMKLEGIHKLVNAGTSWQHFEGRDYDPVNLYAATKQAFEALIDYYVAAQGFQAITLELFDTYGPQDTRGKLIGLLIRALQQDTPIDLSPGEQRIDLTHVDDVCTAFTLAARMTLDGPAGGHARYGAGSGQAESIRELATRLERISGKTLRANWGGRPQRVREVMQPPATRPRLPGWQPLVSIEEGLRALL